MMRREFIALVGAAAAAWPIRTGAQEPNLVRRVGVLLAVNDEAERQTRYSAFRHALEELGWSDGRNLSLITRWPADPAKIRADAAELVALKPDVIFAAASIALPPLHEETTTIPIVFAQVFDPVALGLVKTLARPGGNITGFMVHEAEIAQKWVELLKQLAPTTERVAILQDLRNPKFTLAAYLLYCFSHMLGKNFDDPTRLDRVYTREFTPNLLNQFITDFNFVALDHLSSPSRPF